MNLIGLDGFAEENGNYITNVTFTDDNKRISDDKQDILMLYVVNSAANVAANQGQSIILETGKNLEFACKYSLESKTISSTTETLDTVQEITRTSRGTLDYYIDIEDAFVGQRKSFSVIPVNPGIVYSQLQHCVYLVLDN